MSRQFMITSHGKRLHVETAGSIDRTPLVYLHGGPGASCYDFVAVQVPRLAESFYVITFDQRGVLRSDPICDDEPFGIDDLIADCETLRATLGLSSWNVLGHSFGGYLGVLYATTYPRAVRSLILECPSFDPANSVRSHLRQMAMEWLQEGNLAQAKAAWTTAFARLDTQQVLNAFDTLRNVFGEQRWEALHIHGPKKDFFWRLWAESTLRASLRERSASHARRLLEGGQLDNSIVPLLSTLRQPCLLVKGKYDLVCTDEQVLAFLQHVDHGDVEVFTESGHFPRIDEPERYAEVVRWFVYEKTSGDMK